MGGRAPKRLCSCSSRAPLRGPWQEGGDHPAQPHPQRQPFESLPPPGRGAEGPRSGLNPDIPHGTSHSRAMPGHRQYDDELVLRDTQPSVPAKSSSTRRLRICSVRRDGVGGGGAFWRLPALHRRFSFRLSGQLRDPQGPLVPPSLQNRPNQTQLLPLSPLVPLPGPGTFTPSRSLSRTTAPDQRLGRPMFPVLQGDRFQLLLLAITSRPAPSSSEVPRRSGQHL